MTQHCRNVVANGTLVSLKCDIPLTLDVGRSCYPFQWCCMRKKIILKTVNVIKCCDLKHYDTRILIYMGPLICIVYVCSKRDFVRKHDWTIIICQCFETWCLSMAEFDLKQLYIRVIPHTGPQACNFINYKNNVR